MAPTVFSFQHNKMLDRKDNTNLYEKVAMVMDVMVTQQVTFYVHLANVYIKKLTLRDFHNEVLLANQICIIQEPIPTK